VKRGIRCSWCRGVWCGRRRGVVRGVKEKSRVQIWVKTSGERTSVVGFGNAYWMMGWEIYSPPFCESWLSANTRRNLRASSTRKIRPLLGRHLISTAYLLRSNTEVARRLPKVQFARIKRERERERERERVEVSIPGCN
jgi:hypothetical protein